MGNKFILLYLLIVTGCTNIPLNNQSIKIPYKEEIKIFPEYQKYIVANLATLKLRVYQLKCIKCEAELIFETDMVIGKDDAEQRTKLGFYKIKQWVQFHEDYQKQYLAWNKNPPKPQSSRKQWGPIGAFGWYAAIVGPEADGQWLHGTLGWANEGEKFVQPSYNKNGFIIRLKSHGCIRISNPAISFLKDNVPIGSYLFRIYAKEELINVKQTKQIYWSHSLIFQNQLLDYGHWTKDIKTEAYPVKNQVDKNKYEQPNNPYEIDIKLLGTFLVDKGQVKNYKPPKLLRNGGFKYPPDFFTFKHHE